MEKAANTLDAIFVLNGQRRVRLITGFSNYHALVRSLRRGSSFFVFKIERFEQSAADFRIIKESGETKYFMSEAKEIARTILEQLKENDIRRFWSWGAEQFAFSEDAAAGTVFLQFKVNGAIFKGEVRVVYVFAADTYRVEFYRDSDLVDSFADVYAEDLATLVDEFVEKPASVKSREEYLKLLREKREPYLFIA